MTARDFLKSPKRAAIVVFMVIIFIFSALAIAGSYDIVVVRPGGPTASEQAQQQIDRLTKQIAEKAGWSSVGVVGRYFTDDSKALSYITANKPGFVLGSLGFYLKYRDKLGLRIINQATIGGKTTSKYYIVARKGTVPNLEGLKGKVLAGTHLEEPEFVQRVVFENQVMFGTEVKVLPGRTIRSLRKLTMGKVDAVILDEKEYSSLGELDFAPELELIFTSKDIPNNGFAVITKNVTKSQIAAFEKAASDFCQHSDAKTICEDFNIQGFTPVKDSAYNQFRAMYNKGK